MLIMCGGGKKNTSDKGEVDEMERGGGLTFRGMLSSQSGKLITLAALPTHSTTTVANICTHTFKRKSHKKKNSCLLFKDWWRGKCCTKRGECIQLTCPIPTHIEEGNLEGDSRVIGPR